MTIQAGATQSIALQFLTIRHPGLPTGSADLPPSGDDTFYEFTPSPRGEGVITAGGQPIWAVSQDLSGVLVVTTYPSSLAHKRLGDLVASFPGGVQPSAASLTATRRDNGDSMIATNVWIQQDPVIRGSRTAQVVTWTLWCGQAQKVYGRAIPDGVPLP